MLKPMFHMDFEHVQIIKFCKVQEFCKELDMNFHVLGMLFLIMGMPYCPKYDNVSITELAVPKTREFI